MSQTTKDRLSLLFPLTIIVSTTTLVFGLVGCFVAIGVAAMVCLIAWWLIPYYLVPRQLRAGLRKLVVDDAGPPANSEPASVPIVDQWERAFQRSDWSAPMEFLDESYESRYPQLEKTYDMKQIRKRMKNLSSALRDLDVEVDDVRTVPGSPDNVWVRSTQTMVVRRGPAIKCTGWEKWTLTDSRERVLRAEFLGVTHLA